MIMTLKDLAEYLRMNERTIAKLAQEGKIPGFKIASQWRFIKEAVDSWFSQQMQQTVTTEVAAAEKPKIASLLVNDAIMLDLKSRTKDGVLVEMTEMLAARGRVSSQATLLAALRERERLCSTGIGRGIAFLHPRHVVADIAKESVLAFARSEAGVDFDSVDGQKVHLFFLDLAPTERSHLAMLARLSRLLADESLVTRLTQAKVPDDVIGAVREAENRLVEQ
jgi:PTS system nitrogen regulatory IIA component